MIFVCFEEHTEYNIFFYPMASFTKEKDARRWCKIDNKIRTYIKFKLNDSFDEWLDYISDGKVMKK